MTTREEGLNCYKCVFVGSVPGSAHKRCKHPAIPEAHKDPAFELTAIFASVGRQPPIIAKVDELKIKGDDHGIASGWFNWPWNFDPVWLDNCDGFTPKKDEPDFTAERQDLA